MRKWLGLAAAVCLVGLVLAGAAGAAGLVGRPRVGLALSGGAAKGLAHIGVLKVLEKTGMPIDCVSGASMGSVIGGMYAAGYTAAEIESVAVTIDWAELFSDRTARRMLPMENKPLDSRDIISFPMDGLKPSMPSGLIEGKNVVRLFSQLALPRQRSADFRELPTPFVAVTTDLITGEAVVLDRGFLAEAIRASMSIPSVFSPVEIGGRLLVDGGLVRNLPAVDARDLGADIVIGVDVGKREYTKDELTSIIAISNQTMNLILGESLEEQRKLCDVLIQPDMEGVALAGYGDAKRIIRRGEEAALAMLPRLQALADSVNALSPGDEPSRRTAPAPRERVPLVAFEIRGLSDVPPSVVEREFWNVQREGEVPIDRIERSIDKIRGSGLFETVNARLEGIEKDIRGERLVLSLREKKGNDLGVGLRYDTRRDASALFDMTFRNVLFGGAALSLDAVLRDEFDVSARYLVPLGLIRSFGFKARVDAAKAFLNLYDGDERAAAYGALCYFGEAAFGTLFSTRAAVSAGVRGEYLDQTLEGGRDSFSTRKDTLFPFYGLITIDTLDRKVHARSGVFLQASAEAADETLGSDATFTRFYLDARTVVPAGGRVSFLGNLYLGGVSGDDLPPAYYFFLGGVDEKVTLLGKPASFYGLEHQDRSGRYVQTLQIGAQWEVGNGMLVVLTWNAGNAFEEWSTDVASNRYINGAGLTLGLDSIAGPVEATVMTSEEHDFLFYFSAGYKF